MSSLLNLPAELLVEVAEACSPSEIAHLCQTCRYLHNKLLPELFRTIDLSTHNADTECLATHNLMYNVPHSFLDREITSFDKFIFAKQSKFIKTLQGRQDWGKHIRTLRWTVLDASDHYWGSLEKVFGADGAIIDDDDIDDSDEERAVYSPEDEPLWQVFQICINTTSVDISWLRGWREVTLPPYLFPNATSIKLGGCMTRTFRSRIIAPPFDRFTSIEMNNLMQWSEFEPALPEDTHLRELSAYVHRINPPKISDTRLMVGALDSLIGCCSNLTNLHITTVGEWEPYVPEDHEHNLYQSWTQLLSSVRNTLRSFYFEQGYNRRNYNSEKGYCRPRPTINERKMDRLFVQWLLPVLLEAPWPQMSRMELRGIGRLQQRLRLLSKPPSPVHGRDNIYEIIKHEERYGYKVKWTHMAFPSRAKDELQKLVGNATLVIEEEQSQDYEDISYGDFGIPEYDDLS